MPPKYPAESLLTEHQDIGMKTAKWIEILKSETRKTDELDKKPTLRI